jgi:hypothetical protein
VILLPGATWLLLLLSSVVAVNPGEAIVTRAANVKGYVGLGLYAAAIAAALLGLPYVALFMIVFVAATYFVPTRYF